MKSCTVSAYLYSNFCIHRFSNIPSIVWKVAPSINIRACLFWTSRFAPGFLRIACTLQALKWNGVSPLIPIWTRISFCCVQSRLLRQAACASPFPSFLPLQDYSSPPLLRSQAAPAEAGVPRAMVTVTLTATAREGWSVGATTVGALTLWECSTIPAAGTAATILMSAATPHRSASLLLWALLLAARHVVGAFLLLELTYNLSV